MNIAIPAVQLNERDTKTLKLASALAVAAMGADTDIAQTKNMNDAYRALVQHLQSTAKDAAYTGDAS